MNWDVLDASDSCSKCGRVRVLAHGDVWVQVDRTAAGYAGLVRCGSWSCCPVCAAKAAQRNLRRLERLRRALDQRGGCVAMLTLTLRHHLGHPLAELLDAARQAWTALRRDGSWRRKSRAAGVLGLVRAVECTHGANGWHPHFHVLMIFDGPTSEPFAEQLGRVAHGAWERSLNDQGYESWVDSGGFDVTMPDMAAAWQYATKQGLGLEMTHGTFKKGQQHGRAPFEMLADLAEGLVNGDADVIERDALLWREYRDGFRGWKTLTGLAEVEKRLGLDPWSDDDDDDADVEEDAAPDVDDDLGEPRLIGCSREVWVKIVARRVDWELLAVIRNAMRADGSRAAGLAAARRWFDAQGLPYLLPSDLREKLYEGRVMDCGKAEAIRERWARA